MIGADEIQELTDLEMEIIRRYSKGYGYAQVPYLFETYTITEIHLIKQMLLDHGYAIDEINLFANNKRVGVVLDIFW